MYAQMLEDMWDRASLGNTLNYASMTLWGMFDPSHGTCLAHHCCQHYQVLCAFAQQVPWASDPGELDASGTAAATVAYQTPVHALCSCPQLAYRYCRGR
jgi:hypothetical protein